MNIVGLIPARFNSSRLPGKPLKEIHGKSMLEWVYDEVKKVKAFDEVIVLTDDILILNECDIKGINCLITSKVHKTHIDRIHEYSVSNDANLYVCVCGDEPMLTSDVISEIIPEEFGDIYIGALRRNFTNPVEVVDPSNIKISVNDNGDGVYLSRSPIPFPYKSSDFVYSKIVGVECYSKKALDYFVNTVPGRLEKIEDITLLRFIENNFPINFKLVSTESLSVDTPNDLEIVRKKLGEKM